MATDSCGLCAGTLSVLEPALYDFPNITSDCRPWPAGRAVARCETCGVLQRVLRPQAIPVFDKVYAGYAMFSHASEATDQLNFAANGIGEGRTQKILKFIENKLPKPPSSVLDIGSGSGAGLIALANRFPAARVHGFEPNDKPAERQTALPDNVSVMTKKPSTGQKYDLITLFHVLEHVEDVSDLMRFITSALTPEGRLLIQVPYPACGPFDFIIADHIWHFSKNALASLLRKNDFTITYIDNELIEKELTVLAVAGAPGVLVAGPDESAEERQAIDWLWEYKSFLDGLKSREGDLAVYGTGPAGAWTGAVLGDKVSAYVDDDPARVGSTFNGKPVLSPREIGKSLPVIAAFPDRQARLIAEKNKELDIIVPGGAMDENDYKLVAK